VQKFLVIRGVILQCAVLSTIRHVESCKPRVWTQHSSPSVVWRAERLLRGSRPKFVDTVSLTWRSMVICSHIYRLRSDPQWPRSDYPLLRAIIDWCSVCRSSEGQPTWKLPGEWRPVGHWPSMVPPGRAPHSGSPREPRPPAPPAPSRRSAAVQLPLTATAVVAHEEGAGSHAGVKASSTANRSRHDRAARR